MKTSGISYFVLNCLYVVFAIKLGSVMVSFVSMVGSGFAWVPPATPVTLIVALSFVVSSLVLLHFVPRLGLISSSAYGALTFYGAATSLLTGRFLAWSLVAAITGLALVGLAIQGWRQMSRDTALSES